MTMTLCVDDKMNMASFEDANTKDANRRKMQLSTSVFFVSCFNFSFSLVD